MCEKANNECKNFMNCKGLGKCGNIENGPSKPLEDITVPLEKLDLVPPLD